MKERSKVSPMKGEVVDGYTNFSDCFGEQTATELALIEDSADFWRAYEAAFGNGGYNEDYEYFSGGNLV
jgi:hypothetical protein